jgi:hypothetical protein
VGRGQNVISWGAQGGSRLGGGGGICHPSLYVKYKSINRYIHGINTRAKESAKRREPTLTEVGLF